MADDVAERNEEDKARDDELSRELLAGKLSKRMGAVTYFEPGSPEEKKARAALARRIRDQMPGSLTRELLALAIDPDSKSHFIGMVPARKINFGNLKKGHSSRWRRDIIIAEWIRRMLPKLKKWRADCTGKITDRGLLELAILEASEKFGIRAKHRPRDLGPAMQGDQGTAIIR